MIGGALFKAALKSPLVWACLLVLALGGALKVRAWQLENARQDLDELQEAHDSLRAEHGRTRGELAAALAANVTYAMAEQRRRQEAAEFAAEQARIQAELRVLLARSRAERDDADRTLKGFIAQFNAAPESCRLATVQMEAACASLSGY